MKVLVTQSFPTLCDPMDYKLARLLCPWNSPGKNTGVGSHSFLQGSSQARDRTQVSCIAEGFFTVCATRDAQIFNMDL